VAKWPAQWQQVEQMMRQLPPGAKLAAFELAPVGPTSGEVFEVASFSGTVHFSISEDRLAGADARFAREWGERSAASQAEAAARERSERKAGREAAAGKAEEAR